MPVDYQWDNNDKTIMRYTVQGAWDWNDFYRQMRRSLLWWDDLDHVVDIIIDFRGGDHLPDGSIKLPAGAMAHLRSIGTIEHANAPHRAVVIGVSADLQAKIGAVDGVYKPPRREIRFVENDDQARAVIADWRRGSIP